MTTEQVDYFITIQRAPPCAPKKENYDSCNHNSPFIYKQKLTF